MILKLMTIIMPFILIVSISCSQTDNSDFSTSDAYSIKNFWLNLDQCAEKTIVIFGKIHWISPDRKNLDIYDGHENLSIFFSDDSFLKSMKIGQDVYIKGFVNCAFVQKGVIDKFVHNASMQGIQIMKK